MIFEIIGVELYLPVIFHPPVEFPPEPRAPDIPSQHVEKGFPDKKPDKGGDEELEQGNMLSDDKVEGHEGCDLPLYGDADCDNKRGPLGIIQGEIPQRVE